MALDPRRAVIPNDSRCEPSNRRRQRESSNRRDFFNTLGKIGDIEELNNVRASDVGKGLRTLATISNSIRVGASIPSSFLNDANAEEVVFDTCGINTNAAIKTIDFNPSVFNRAAGQARAIYRKVKQGEFEQRDIPESFSDLQNLSTLISSVFTERPNLASRNLICDPSPYATDLIAFAPKYKFLFIVDITPSPGYASAWGNLYKGFAFVVKTSSRPNVEFDYEEVNFYNFRSRVPRRTTYQPMNMRFYDDTQNTATLFYNTYLRAMSPIANIKFDQQIQTRNWYEKRGMNWNAESFKDNTGTLARQYSASLGPAAPGVSLDSAETSIISELRLFHVYKYGAYMNAYHFYNPRITAFEPDELDMADGSTGSEMAFSFLYDGLFLQTGIDVQAELFGGRNDITQLSGGAINAPNPIRPIFTDDTSEVTDEVDSNSTLGGTITEGLKSVTDLAGRVTAAPAELVSAAFNATSDFAGSIFDG